MADLSTKYLGLRLRSPIIAASSGMTRTSHLLQELEKKGVGAVILKSIFEEEITAELNAQMANSNRPSTIYPEIYDAFDYSDMEDSVSKYLFLIEEAKRTLTIPVIGSVNCVSSHEWTLFAKRIEEAGADALELNMFILPSDFNRTGEDNEKVYFEVIEKVKKVVSIPVSLKISYYFSNLGSMIQRLSNTGIDGLVLFNRFFSPDIDIDNLKIVPTNIYSTPAELSISLRWIAIMAQRVGCDLAASTGVHDGSAVVKQLLAGANAVQVASTLYKNGFDKITEMNNFLTEWMEEHNYSTIDDFRGKMSQASTKNPAAYERVQFMMHFAGKGVN
ncbi:MAG: dihydroorotate dehydrogenase-like protein [Candidatus Kapabacteria bacterium]|nr:dihydroorotate dehydrogenase-like protein [Ignavibacteriota bacterium]MCW5884487.1 dihydroorotate dehydrogenase-like protein [Candidatus Kapabacteria bacterium]